MIAHFFCRSPLPFGGSTVLSLTRGLARNRTITGSLSATQVPRTNWAARTTKTWRDLPVESELGWSGRPRSSLMHSVRALLILLPLDRFKTGGMKIWSYGQINWIIGMEMSFLPGVNMSCQTLLLHLMEKRKGLQMKLFICFFKHVQSTDARSRRGDLVSSTYLAGIKRATSHSEKNSMTRSSRSARTSFTVLRAFWISGVCTAVL